MGTRYSPQKRLQAARSIRAGNSYPKTYKATGVPVRTIARWMTEDPEFLLLVRGQGVLQVGPVRLVADHDAPTLDAVEGHVWITPTGEVLGSLVVESATHLKCVFVPAKSVPAVRAELEAGNFPVPADAPSTVLRADALPALAEPENVSLLVTLCTAPLRESFAAFLTTWKYRSQEEKAVLCLGDGLWAGQSAFADALCQHERVVTVKSRKTGISTVSVAWVAYCLRWRDVNARAHVFSRTEKSALELFAAIKFGLDSTPAWMQLPTLRQTMKEWELDAGAGDRRLLVSYPTAASGKSAVEAQASVSMVDEWSTYPRPADSFSALEPTFAGSAVLIFTGGGPANETSEFWRRSIKGETSFYPIFIDADQRPGRGPEFRARKLKTMLAGQVAQEYPMSWEEALQGTGEYLYDADSIDKANIYCRYGTGAGAGRYRRLYPFGVAVPNRKYVIGWDVAGPGEKADASVGTCLDITDGQVLDVADQRRFVGLSYVRLVQEIEQMHRDFAAMKTAVEVTGLGGAVFGHLHIPKYELIEWKTTQVSKPKMIYDLGLALQGEEIKFSHADCPELARELRGYQEDDEHCDTDTVLSLAVALQCAAQAYANRPGRILGVYEF